MNSIPKVSCWSAEMAQGKSPVSRPDVLWTNGDRHTEVWSTLMDDHNQGKKENQGREGKKERPQPG